MSDGISYKIITQPFVDGITQRQARMPGAARSAIGQIVKITQQAARDRTPVWSGKPAPKGPVPGMLRKSITPGPTSSLGRSVFAVKVGPRGDRPHLYAQKEEARAGYMDAGEAAARAAMDTIARAAFERVWAG